MIPYKRFPAGILPSTWAIIFLNTLVFLFELRLPEHTLRRFFY